MLAGSSVPAASYVGHVIDSEARSGVRYQLERLIGEGGMGLAYLARAEGPEGSALVVIKFMRPNFADGAVSPELVAMKEAVALGRLNEHVPPTPFVVRLIDAGRAQIFGAEPSPWTAIEYVHGGVEGTTLEDRVTYSLHKTGYAFDTTRAAHTIRCLAAGLDAIHSVSVLHRDFTPGNVLCCGFGETEIFKIADFGVARALGIDGSFVGLSLGTMGYAAPESISQNAGAFTDVFSFACVVYYLLTGQRYFEVDNPKEAYDAFSEPYRASVGDHAGLTPELAHRPDACRAIDQILSRATSLAPHLRPQSAGELAAELLFALAEPGAVPIPNSSALRLTAVLSERHPTLERNYRFIVRSRPRPDLVIGSAAWDADGHALTVSQHGAWFWNGQEWQGAAALLALLEQAPTFTRRHEAGGWLVGGGGPTLSVLDPNGVAGQLQSESPSAVFQLASGRIDHLLAAVEARGENLVLSCWANRSWLAPYPLHGVRHVTALVRLDEKRWLFAGRLLDGTGFAAVYSPFEGRIDSLATPALRAFIDGTSAPERALGLLVGSDGVVTRVERAHVESSIIEGTPDLAAAAIDILGNEWAASRGALHSRNPYHGQAWRTVFHDPNFTTPFVSLMAEAGYVIAMTADGGIVEGRAGADS